MFTGIVEELGIIRKIAEKKDIDQYQIQTASSFTADVKTGDSIAINGVCLTAYDIQEETFVVDVSQETKRCTTFGGLIRNNQVNLERAVTPSTRLGGHIVSGHVDGLGKLTDRIDHENESILWVTGPSDLTKYIAIKGSICIDGVSLTVNQIKQDQHCVTIIPHTLQNTTLNSLQHGDMVNIEVDLLARYVEKLIRST